MRARMHELKGAGYWYLASPYTHVDPEIRDLRAREANLMGGLLLANGIYVYQAIWSTHQNSLQYELPMDHLFWLGMNKAFIDPSVGMIMCDIDGWKESKGCQQEIEYVRSLNKPIWLFDGYRTLTQL